MYLVGLVHEIDPVGMRARVRFPDRDDLVSWWLPIGVPFAQDNRAYRMPDLGEQVACLMDDHLEAGVIVCSIYGGSEIPPESSRDVAAWRFKDGAVFRYDRQNHHLRITLPPGGTVEVVADGGLHIVGDITHEGRITSTGDHIAGGISLMHHVHGGVQAGGSTTGGPQ